MSGWDQSSGRSDPASEVSPTSLDKRAPLVRSAVAAWTGELIDLGGRNTLLYYRDLNFFFFFLFFLFFLVPSLHPRRVVRSAGAGGRSYRGYGVTSASGWS